MLVKNHSFPDQQRLAERLQHFYHEQWRDDRALLTLPEPQLDTSALNKTLRKHRLSHLPVVGRHLRRLNRLWRALTSADTRLRDKLMAVPIIGKLVMWVWGMIRFLHFKYETITMIRQLDGQMTALQSELKSTRKQMALQAREIQQLRALLESRSQNDTPSV